MAQNRVAHASENLLLNILATTELAIYVALLQSSSLRDDGRRFLINGMRQRSEANRDNCPVLMQRGRGLSSEQEHSFKRDAMQTH